MLFKGAACLVGGIVLLNYGFAALFATLLFIKAADYIFATALNGMFQVKAVKSATVNEPTMTPAEAQLAALIKSYEA